MKKIYEKYFDIDFFEFVNQQPKDLDSILFLWYSKIYI